MNRICCGCAIAAAVFMSILSSGCTKTAYAQTGSQPQKKLQVASGTAMAPDSSVQNAEKIRRVFSRVNPRAKSCIEGILSDLEEFLSDLQIILDEEKEFRSDDKSLFFLIDKKNTAESTYIPKDLIELKANRYFNLNKSGMFIRPEAYEALKEMSLAAQDDGITLLVSSVYRSYKYQENLFNYWVSVDGLEEAERESARAGTSQHQLGTAVDFGSISDDFGSTAMGKWVYRNAARYGWSLSFPKGYEDVTGYRWECWHFRYVGRNACLFQEKWFGDVQQFMLEFIKYWKED